MTPTKPYFTVTNNVTRVTFEYVRDNRNKTRVEVAKHLEKQGYKPSSVSSLLGQMVKQGLISEVSGFLSANSDTYTPLKASKLFKAAPQPRKIAKPIRKAAPIVEPTPTPQDWTVESVIGSLNVRQAMAVYDELRKLFGG